LHLKTLDNRLSTIRAFTCKITFFFLESLRHEI